MIRSSAAVLALILAACATAPVTVPGDPLGGQWGGRHVGLLLGPSGGTLEYDCAAGTIEGPLLVRGDGSFIVEGTHTPGTGGPERVGEVRPSHAARYSGHVRGDRMTLQVRVENGILIGPYSLRRNAEPIILRCL